MAALAARLEPPRPTPVRDDLPCVDVDGDGICTPLEVSASPDVLFGAVRLQLDAAAQEIGTGKDYASVAGAVAEGRRLIDRSAKELARGEPCPAAKSFRDGAAELRDALSILRDLIPAYQAAARVGAPILASDVADEDLAASWISVRGSLVTSYLNNVLDGQQVVDGVCRAVKGKLHAKGRVVETDDAGRVIRFDTGAELALSSRPLRGVSKGRQITTEGVLFNDGTGVITAIKGAAKLDQVPEYDNRCLHLRVAPIQRFAPQYAVTPTLHFPEAYENQGALALEDGMRFAAKAVTGCPTATPDGKALIYSMQIDVEQDGQTQTMAVDLEDGETPVRLPKYLSQAPTGGYPSLAIVTATVSRKQCSVLPGPTYVCQPPVALTTETHYIQVLDRGHYARVEYSETIFGVSQNGVDGDFGVTSMSEIAPGFILEGTNPEFEAEGYRAWASGNSYPQVNKIAGQQSFAVLDQDFSAPTDTLSGLLSAEARFWSTGQSTRSALRWAHVKGTRNGRTFWYSARLPALVRDRIEVCPAAPALILSQGPPRNDNDPNTPANWPPVNGPFQVIAAEDSFYEMPLPNGFTHQAQVNGNITDFSPGRRHGENQAYAVDFGAPMNTLLLAARGGIVVDVQESDKYRFDDPNRPPLWPLVGNFIYIRHDDDTYAVYFHLPQNGALVNVGDRVVRGQVIGRVGETGRASAPHVHFSVAKRPVSDIADYDAVRIRYRMGHKSRQVFDFPEVQVDRCYIPQSRHILYSTNG